LQRFVWKMAMPLFNREKHVDSNDRDDGREISPAQARQLTQALFAGSFVASVPRAWKGFAWAATLLLLLIHLIAAPLLGIARIAYQANVSSRMDRAMASVPSDRQIAFQDLVLINPPDHIDLVTAIWAVKQLENLPRPRHMRALSNGGALVVTRVGPRSLRLRFPDGFFPTAFSRYLRSPSGHVSVRPPSTIMTWPVV
jgi:hypothetical protein